MKRNPSIVLVRVLAMSMIIFTHICQFFNWVSIRSLMFGVPLFLLISGYLYGNKKVTDFKAFLFGRWEKIIIPVWIFELFVFTYSSVILKIYPTFQDILIQFLNLQGLQNILLNSKIYPFISCEILWFTTVIMACYFWVPVLQKMKQSNMGWYGLLVLAILAVIMPFAGIRLSYFFVFSVGYYLPIIQKKLGKGKVTLYSLIIVLVSGVIRLMTRPVLDGSILYNEVIVAISFDSMAFFTVNFVNWIAEHIKTMFEKIGNHPVLIWIDGISFYVYMTHYLFFKGFWNVRNYINGIYLQIMVLLVLSILLALPFKYVCDKILRYPAMKRLRTSTPENYK